MASQSYRRLELVEFGRRLFVSQDLDPVYVALPAAGVTGDRLARWMVAYWAFYHCGFACYASEREGLAFWDALAVAASNVQPTPFGGRWPRGAERRHYRGKAAEHSVAAMRERYGDRPEGMVDFLADGPLTIPAIIERGRHHPVFGNWIGFKIADMLDALWGVAVDQSDVSVFLYETPRRSIIENADDGTFPFDAPEGMLLELALDWLGDQLADCRIPHKLGRAPDRFTLETVLCKHLSHRHGHYPLLKDIPEIRHGMVPWLTHSETARRFLAAMPNDSVRGLLVP